MKSHVASIKCQIFHKLASSIAIAAALAATGAAVADPLNPFAYPSLGTVTLAAGSYALNSTTLALSGPGTALTGTVQTDIAGPDIAVFCFDSLTVQSGAVITITGTRPVALLSRGDLIFAGTLSANGGVGGTNGSNNNGGVGVAGGGSGGAVNTRGVGPGAGLLQISNQGGGGGFGGRGGGNNAVAGPANGAQPNFQLAGGSGGDGELVSPGAGGGAGGGAVELGAMGSINLSGGVISVAGAAPGTPNGGFAPGGGSGGGVLLHAASTVPGTIIARGGDAASTVNGSGGGGRVAIQALSDPGTTGISVAPGTGYPTATAGVISFRAVSVAVANIDFGNVAVGSSRTMFLPVQNTGATGSYANGEFPGAAAPFARVGPSLFTGLKPGVVMAGAYTFTPMTAGPSSQTLPMSTDAGTMMVTLTGVGAAPVCRGDFNLDGTFDGQDVQGFVSALVSGQTCP